MKIYFIAESVEVESNGYRNIQVSAEIEHHVTILENINVEDAVSYYNVDDVLDVIGKDIAMEYFGLEEPKDED